MRRKENNIDFAENKTSLKTIGITAVAAIPVFFMAYFYTDMLMDRDDEMAAMLITVYFIGCIYVGRYISNLWIQQNNTISGKTLIITCVIVTVSAALVFFLAQLTLSSTLTFVITLVVGFPLTILGLSLGILIKLTRTTIQNQIQEAKAAAAQSQSELRFLQGQLSPHFLFNTLNNIYGLSLTQHEKVPGLLLKLSDLLRYSVYDAKESFVPLKAEVAYIKDYIEFEKIRIGDKLELNATFEEDIDPGIKIAPLLLIVFIENAFKHSKNTTEQKIYINITLKTWGNSILFAVRNSINAKADENSMLKTNSGFGLDNVMKILELLYTGAYDLDIQNTDEHYTAMLQLKMK
jgi:sensor histidine kinase YesM